jgi:hypothetical protein
MAIVMDELKADRWSKLLSQQQMQKHVDSIVKQYNASTRAQREAGRTWYERAHDIATDLGKGDAKKGAGIISALSPMIHWDLNIKNAKELVKTGKTTSVGGMHNVRKAQAILAGQDPDELFSMATGPKTTSFYRNIANPSDPHPVTIDRHAYDSNVERKGALHEDLQGKLKGGRYEHHASAIRNAAFDLGGNALPNQVQATNWGRWREIHGIQ